MTYRVRRYSETSNLVVMALAIKRTYITRQSQRGARLNS